MPSDRPSPPVSPESLARKHEVSEKRVRNVLWVGGSAVFMLFFSLFAAGAEIYLLSRGHPMQHIQPYGLIIAPNLKPLERFPKPNLEIDDDHAQMTTLLSDQDARISSYGWVDRSHGVLHIPIGRAMDLLLERGLPVNTNASPSAGESTLQLIQKIPEQK